MDAVQYSCTCTGTWSTLSLYQRIEMDAFSIPARVLARAAHGVLIKVQVQLCQVGKNYDIAHCTFVLDSTYSISFYVGAFLVPSLSI